MSARPHLILTLRRTGGTSLMSFLSKASPFPGVQHEPFNQGRKWGETTRDFENDGDVAALEAAIGRRLDARPNIKHCVELVPTELTRALIDACRERDYGFFLLTRRDEARRLVSLYLAMATGAWGAEQAEAFYPEIIAGRMKLSPVRLDGLRKRVLTDAAALGRTLAILRHRRVPHDWLIFEELYKGDEPVERQALRIAAGLGIEVAPDDPRLAAFARRSGQGSEQIEAHVPWVGELKTELSRLLAR